MKGSRGAPLGLRMLMRGLDLALPETFIEARNLQRVAYEEGLRLEKMCGDAVG